MRRHLKRVKKNPKKRIWFRSGQYFGVQKGRVVVFVRDIYGTKDDGSSWASEHRKMMIDLGSNTCISDGDVWMRVSVDTSELGETTDYGLPAGEHL